MGEIQAANFLGNHGGRGEEDPMAYVPKPRLCVRGGEKKLVCAKNVITLKASTFFSAFPLKEELGREGRKRNPLDHKSKEKKEGWGGRTFLAVTLTCQRANPIFIVFRPPPSFLLLLAEVSIKTIQSFPRTRVHTKSSSSHVRRRRRRHRPSERVSNHTETQWLIASIGRVILCPPSAVVW